MRPERAGIGCCGVHGDGGWWMVVIGDEIFFWSGRAAAVTIVSGWCTVCRFTKLSQFKSTWI